MDKKYEHIAYKKVVFALLDHTYIHPADDSRAPSMVLARGLHRPDQRKICLCCDPHRHLGIDDCNYCDSNEKRNRNDSR